MKLVAINPGQFVVWITCMLEEYEDAIIAGLVKKGYQVSAAAMSGKISMSIENGASVVITLRVDSSKEDMEPGALSKDIADLMAEKRFLYYSIVVSVLAGSSWYPTNIILPKEPTATPPPLPEPEPDRNLN